MVGECPRYKPDEQAYGLSPCRNESLATNHKNHGLPCTNVRRDSLLLVEEVDSSD